MKLKLKFICVIITFLFFQLLFTITSLASSENLNIGSPACILIESSTGKILYEKNAKEKMYPASTTKIMTAILTVENCELSDVVTASHNAIYSVPPTYSHASIVEGEELTVEQLLNVLLIQSASDAANILAEHIGGTIENFAQMMTNKAKEIGCKNTHYVNPDGVSNDDHYTTAYDLALMGQYAMKYDAIRNIVCKTQYTLPKTNKYDKEDRIFNTTNELLRVNHSNSPDNYYYEYATGIKTGYTTEAGSCIVASAEKDGLEVIAVVLGAETTEEGYSIRYPDCKTLFNYAFDNYKVEDIVNPEDVIEEINVADATKDTSSLKLSPESTITAVMDKDQSLEELQPAIEIDDNLAAPISAGEVVGKVTYTIDNKNYSTNLIADNTVVKSGTWDILFRICVIILVLAILFMLLKPRKKTAKKRKGGGKSKSKYVGYKHLKL